MCKPYQNKWDEGRKGKSLKGGNFKINVNTKGAKPAIIVTEE